MDHMTGVYIRCGNCKLFIGISDSFEGFMFYHKLRCPCGHTYYVTVSKRPPHLFTTSEAFKYTSLASECTNPVTEVYKEA